MVVGRGGEGNNTPLASIVYRRVAESWSERLKREGRIAMLCMLEE